MRRLRSKCLLRCTALLLVGAMLPALFAPSSRAASGSLASSYAEWIRAQLKAPAHPSVERALKKAAQADANSFNTFVAAFLEAYEAQYPQESAARAFTDKDLSNDALITYLQRRYTEISGEAVLLRLRVVGTSINTSSATGSTGNHAPQPRGVVPVAPGLISAAASDGVLATLRTATPARPQGP